MSPGKFNSGKACELECLTFVVVVFCLPCPLSFFPFFLTRVSLEFAVYSSLAQNHDPSAITF